MDRHICADARARLAGHSLAAAQRLDALGPAFGLTNRQLRQRFLARVHELAGLDAEVDAIWQAPPTLERIRSFMTMPRSDKPGPV